VMEADLILVLDGGRVVQRGTHAQLIASSGLYQTLWQIQTTVTDALGELNDLVEAEVVDV
jgi:ABC-type transport system involved in cytochrome bd biosynthesis fused ATPase/permease subunit